MKDLMGQAILDYYHDNSADNLLTETSISEIDDLPVEYLFRDFKNMNLIEQKALELSKGKTLDIGAGAGSHSLYLQNEKDLDILRNLFKKFVVELEVMFNLLRFFFGNFMTI